MDKKVDKKSSVNLPDDNQLSVDISRAFDDPNTMQIGLVFMDARAKKGLTQEQASQQLKVRLKIITDFEEGKALELPGLAYQIGFVRSYANLVDLDTDYCVESFKQSLNLEDSKVSYNFLESKKEKKSLVPIFVLATFLICLVSYSTWYFNNLNSNDNNVLDHADNRENLPNPMDYVKVEEKLAAVNQKASDLQNSDIDLAKSDRIKSLNVDAENAKKNINLEEKLLSQDLDSQKNKKIKKTNQISAVANVLEPEKEMVLKSSGNSWVEIEDLDGNALVTRLMRTGETYVIPKNNKGLTLSTGNAGVLSLTYGNVHIDSLGEVGEVITSRPLNIEALKDR